MAVRIFVEKENELLCNHTKNHPKLFSGSATIETSLLQTPRTGKVLTTTPHLQPSARKALGDVNCPLRAGSIPGHSLKKKPDRIHKKKNNARITKAKPSNSSNSEPPKCCEKSEDYPEMETFIPYNPLGLFDFDMHADILADLDEVELPTIEDDFL